MSEAENNNDQAGITDDEEMPIENIAPSNENNGAQHHGNENESENAPVTTNEPKTETEEAPLPRIVFKYRCYPLSSIKANKMAETHPASLILPTEALRTATRLNAPLPLAFQVQNPKNGQTTVCGVSEFIANKKGRAERNCYVPDWIMENLGLKRGQNILVTYVKLPLGNTVLLQAQSVDFLEVSDPKMVLQSALAKFHCISKEDIIPISDDGKVYKMKVLETKPSDSICIRDIDLNVDFVAPVGYEEPKKEDPKETEVVEAPDFSKSDPKKEDPKETEVVKGPAFSKSVGFMPFSGVGHRLNGKPIGTLEQSKVPVQRGIADESWEFGNVQFIRTPKPSKNIAPVQKPTAFIGPGSVLDDRPRPEFDEPPSKRKRTSGPSDSSGESIYTDNFVDEKSEDSDMEIEDDDDDSDHDPNVQ